MSIESEISSLRSELSRLERENARLRAEISNCISALSAASNTASTRTRATLSTVDYAQNGVDDAINLTQWSMQTQEEIVALSNKYRKLQTAYKRNRQLMLDLRYKLAHVQETRRVFVSLWDSFSSTLVSDAVIESTVEKTYLKAQDFFLSYICMAIVKWRKNDRKKAEEALAIGYKIEPRATAVIMFLFNLRMHRYDTALLWYKDIVKTPLLFSDSELAALLYELKIYVDREVCPALYDAVSETISAMDAEKNNAEAFISHTIMEHLQTLCEAGAYDFPFISRYCSEAQVLFKACDFCSANTKVYEWVNALSIELGENKLDLMCDNFIASFIATTESNETRIINDEIKENEILIAFAGDTLGAEREIENNKKHECAPYNPGADFAHAIVGDAMSLQDKGFKSYAVANCVEQIDSAYAEYTDFYRQMFHRPVTVNINNCSFSSTLTDSENDKKKIDDFFAKKAAAEKSALKLNKIIAFGVLAALLLIGGIVALAVIPNVLILSVCFIGFAAFASLFAVHLYKRIATLKEIAAANEALRLNTRDVFDSLCNDYKSLTEVFQNSDAYVTNVLDCITALKSRVKL